MFTLLEFDENVLLFGKDAFTVGRFKELVRQDFDQSKANNVVNYLNNISVGTVNFQLGNIKWNSPTQDCKLLTVGAKGWQKGKIRFQVIYTYRISPTEVYLEFCPDEPSEPESPLDDLRQLPEYKNVSSLV